MIATLQLVMKLSQDGPNVRCDLSSLGDLTPDGWKEGNVETGPNYFASVVVPGNLPNQLPQDTINEIGMAMRKYLLREVPKMVAGD